LSKIKGELRRNYRKGQANGSSNGGIGDGNERKQGRSESEISKLTGVPACTVHNILIRAHGWDEIAEGDVFKRHRQEQNKALEQANRTLVRKSLKKAEGNRPIKVRNRRTQILRGRNESVYVDLDEKRAGCALTRISHNGIISRAASPENTFTSMIRGDQHYCHTHYHYVSYRF
jgi:hypothetical protein